MDSRNASVLARLREELDSFEKVITDTSEEHKKEIESVAREHEEEIAKLNKAHEEELERLRLVIKEKDEEVTEAKRELETANKVKSACISTVTKLEDTIMNLKEKHDKALKQILGSLTDLEKEREVAFTKLTKEMSELKEINREDEDLPVTTKDETLEGKCYNGGVPKEVVCSSCEHSPTKKDEENEVSIEEIEKLKEEHARHINTLKEEFEAKVTELEKQKEEQEDKIKFLEESYALLNTDFSAVKAENTKYKKSVQTLTQKNYDLITDAKTKDSLLRLKDGKLSDLQKDLEVKTEELKKLRTENATLKKQIDTGKLKAASAKSTIQEKESKIVELNKEKAKVIQKDKLIKQQQTDIEKLSDNVRALQKSLDMLEKIKIDERDSLEKSEAHAKELSEEIKILEAEVDMLKEHRFKLIRPVQPPNFNDLDDNGTPEGVGSPFINEDLFKPTPNKAGDDELLIRRMLELVNKLKDQNEFLGRENANKNKVIAKYRESTLRNLNFQVHDAWKFVKSIDDIIAEIGAFKEYIAKQVQNVDLRTMLTKDLVNWNKVVSDLKPYAQKMTGILSSVERTINLEVAKYDEIKEVNANMAAKAKSLEKEVLDLKVGTIKMETQIDSLKKKSSVSGGKNPTSPNTSYGASIVASRSSSRMSSKTASRGTSRASSPPPCDESIPNVVHSPSVDMLSVPGTPHTSGIRRNSTAPQPKIVISPAKDSSALPQSTQPSELTDDK